MAIIEVKDGDTVGAIQEFLRTILDRGLVSAILAPQEIPSGKTVVQSLVRDPQKLSAVNPLAPVFGVNSARIIAKMCTDLMRQPSPTSPNVQDQEEVAEGEAPPADNPAPEQDEELTAEEGQNNSGEQTSSEAQATTDEQSIESDEGPTETVEHPSDVDQLPDRAVIGVVLRPCEIRALVELVKLQQVSLDSFLIIGVDCWGTYSVQDYAEKVSHGSQDSSVTSDFLKQAAAGSFPEDLRSACRVCQHPAPTCADLVIQLIGEDMGRQIRVQSHTEKGEAVLGAMELETGPDSGERQSAIDAMKDAKKQLAQENPPDFLELISSLCINCHNCRAVCPICYCKQCVFDGEVFAYPLEKYLNWSDKKGVLGLPTDKLLFHLTRMSHVATAWVAGGQCEAACPSRIPLGEVYQKISTAAQEALGYEAGRSLDDELPLTTFREEELSVVED